MSEQDKYDLEVAEMLPFITDELVDDLKQITPVSAYGVRRYPIVLTIDEIINLRPAVAARLQADGLELAARDKQITQLLATNDKWVLEIERLKEANEHWHTRVSLFLDEVEAYKNQVEARDAEIAQLKAQLAELQEDSKDRIITFCPECGVNVSVDEDGLCVTCGATAVGTGVRKLALMVEKLKAELRAGVGKGGAMIEIPQEMKEHYRQAREGGDSRLGWFLADHIVFLLAGWNRERFEREHHVNSVCTLGVDFHDYLRSGKTCADPRHLFTTDEQWAQVVRSGLEAGK
jgi:hypothetical protein